MKSFILISAVLVILWEKLRRPKICEKKIHKHIKDIGGEVIWIKKIGIRDEIYRVSYKIDEPIEAAIVKFNLFYHMDWE